MCPNPLFHSWEPMWATFLVSESMDFRPMRPVQFFLAMLTALLVPETACTNLYPEPQSQNNG